MMAKADLDTPNALLEAAKEAGIRAFRLLLGLAMAAVLMSAWPAAAATVLVAVAANFAVPLQSLQIEFERASGHELKIAIGSTGKLYAQIVKGAPFDVMLAADQERPQRLEAEGHAVAGSRFTYATGRLALWSRDRRLFGENGYRALTQGRFRRLAMANPKLAPYGLAAQQTLEALGYAKRFADRIVLAENIGQAFAMVNTGNAELGFVAMSSLLSSKAPVGGSRWPVPARLYSPIRQDAVLLRHGADSEAAIAFMSFLASPGVRSTIARFGYGSE